MKFRNVLVTERSLWHDILTRTGGLALFTLEFFKRVWRRPFEVREFFNQLDEIGTKSFLLTAITGLALGVVLSMQTRGTLARFGAEAVLPNMLTLSVFKEIGPVITSLVLAGRLGAGMGAEIGSMRVTEQIDALEVAALKPFHYLVITRVVACVVMFPILTIWTDIIALFGGYVETVLSSNMDYRIFINTAFSTLRFSDLIVDTMKTSLFGFLVGIVSCYLGYHVRGGTREVGQAAMQSVVIASLLILLSDVIVVRISLMLFGNVGA